MKQRSRGIAAVLALILILLPIGSTAAFARVTEADKQKVEEQLSKNDSELAAIAIELEKLKAQSAEAVQIKDKLDLEAATLQDNIDLTEQLIATYEQSIKDTIIELSEKQRQADEQYEQIKTYLRSSYESGNSNYLEILFSSSSLTEMMTRIERLRSLVSFRESQIRELEEQRTYLATLRTRYEKDLAQTEKLHLALLEDQAALNANIAEAQAIIDKLKTNTIEAQKMQAAYKAAEEEFEKRLQEIIDELERQAAAGIADGPYIWPCLPTRTRISSYYGWRPDPFTGEISYHNGTDIPTATGEPIYASNNGVVVEARKHLTYGYYILLSHGDGVTTLYAHNSKLNVTVGETVKKGQVIAKAGSTGKSTGPHCHFEMRINGSRVDPLDSSNPGGIYIKIPS